MLREDDIKKKERIISTAISMLPQFLDEKYHFTKNEIKEIMNNFEVVSYRIIFYYREGESLSPYGNWTERYQMSVATWTIKVFDKTLSGRTEYCWRGYEGWNGFSEYDFAYRIGVEMAKFQPLIGTIKTFEIH